MDQNTVPQTIGPYRVLARLGKGGMGAVYRAIRPDTGERVAIKTVELPRASHMAALRREIHALASVKHPGVVRIRTVGLHEGLPWYAMELVDGVELRHHPLLTWRRLNTESARTMSASMWTLTDMDLESGSGAWSAPERPLPAARLERLPVAGGRLVEALTVALRLCDALGDIHGQGIIHGDLKPGNVILRVDGSPVLVDFGLMNRFSGPGSREALTHTYAAAGTIHYMPPEQIRAEAVDPRADLYSLGCVLYEMLAGVRAFDGVLPQDVIEAQLEHEPPRLADLVDDVPDGLQLLIDRLLAKQPADRVGHATDVAYAIGCIMGIDGPELRAPVRTYLYRPQLRGRAAPEQVLGHALDEAVDRFHGGLCLVYGPSGVGKTRLVSELARSAERSGAWLLLGECPAPVDLGTARRLPLLPFQQPLQAIADYCREGGPDRTAAILGNRGAYVAPYAGSIAALCDPKERRAGTELALASKELLFRALLEILTEFALHRATVLVLDDLHWADPLTLGFLRHLRDAQHVAATPLLVVGTFRTEETHADLELLREGENVTRVELDGLGREAVGQMIGDALANPRPPEGLVDGLTRMSKGNPFFVSEYLRTAVAEGLLVRNARGSWHVAASDAGDAESFAALPTPGSVEEVLLRRLEGLPPQARRILEAAAVLGVHSDWDLLADVVGGEDAELLDGVSHLLLRDVLEEPEPARLRFVHHRIREVAYERVALDRRTALHRAVAEAIEIRRHVAPRSSHGSGSGLRFGHYRSFELVGRQAELNLIGSHLDATRNGQGSVLLIEGEAGSGKSALLGAVLSEATRGGHHPLLAAASSMHRAIPYFPWRRIFRQILGIESGADPGEACAALAHEHPELARLMPLMAGVLGTGWSENETTRQMQGPVRADNLRRLLLGILADRARRGPLVLVLEDAHWADSASWTLAQLVCVHVPEAALIVAMRPPPARLVALHLRLASVAKVRLRLGGLSSADTSTIVRSRLGVRELSPDLAAWIHQMTGGNPFFVLELVRSLVERAHVRVEGATCGWADRPANVREVMPPTVEGVVAQRLERLTDSQRAIVETATVAGPLFDKAELSELGRDVLNGEEVALGLLQLQRAGLLVRLPVRGEPVYRFTHAITRDVAYHRIGKAALRPIHRLAAERLEGEPEEPSGLNPLLAHHWQMAEEPEKAVEYLARAGERALKAGVDVEAIDFFERAIELDARHGQASVFVRARWQHLLGQAKFRLGRLSECLEHQLHLLRQLGAPFPTSGPGCVFSVLASIGRRMVRPLVAWRPAARSEEKERLLVVSGANRLISNVEYFSNRGLHMTAATLRALRYAERAGPTLTLARELAPYAVLAGLAGMRRIADRAFRRAVEIGSGDLSSIAWIRNMQAIWLYGTGDWLGGDRAATEAISCADELGDSQELETAGTLRALRAYFTGDFSCAYERFAEVEESARRRSSGQHEAWGLLGMAEAYLPMGRVAEAIDYLERSLQLLEHHPDAAASLISSGLLARAYQLAGLDDEALATAQRTSRLIQGAAPRVFTMVEAYGGVCEVYLAAWSQHLQAGSARTGELAQTARRMLAAIIAYARLFPVARPRALLIRGRYAELDGSLPRARRFYRRSGAAATRLGMPYERALSCHALAHAGRESERARYGAEAEALFSRLGCEPPPG